MFIQTIILILSSTTQISLSAQSAPSSSSDPPCTGFCQDNNGVYPYNCAINIGPNIVNYMCGKTTGCYYATDPNDPGPYDGFCIYKTTVTTTGSPTMTPIVAPVANNPAVTVSPTRRLTCNDVWDNLATDAAGTYSCGSRITYLMEQKGKAESEAKTIVANEFPNICGPCTGDNDTTSTPTSSPTLTPTSFPISTAPTMVPTVAILTCDDVWDNLATDAAGTYSCGARITYLIEQKGKTESEAKTIVANEFPAICGPCAVSSNNPTPAPSLVPTSIAPPPSTLPTTKILTCDDVWDDLATDSVGTYPCGARITYLVERQGKTLSEAKNIVATEFPFICGPCRTNVTPAPSPSSPPPPSPPSSQKCGGAVNAGHYNCQPYLWTPTQNPSQHCYAYGGPSDPCALHNNNDADDGLYKNPSLCDYGDTFYLWDEPDTQGKSYAWAGNKWREYATRWRSELFDLRSRRGVKVTTPLITMGGPGVAPGNLREFFDACGPSCQDDSHPAYIDVVAVNAFCGPWNINDPTNPAGGCRSGAVFTVNEVNSFFDDGDGGGTNKRRPVYVTNWSRLRTDAAVDQLAAIEGTDGFFGDGSGVERVYWFGARDYGGGSSNNYLTDVVDGKTLGQYWEEKCESL